MSGNKLRLILLLSTAIVVVTSCVKTAEPRVVPRDSQPDPTATPAPIIFPEDKVDHDSRLEWWYHSGHLETESGREFGFHFVVFKADDGLSEPNLVAQLGILDVETGQHYEASRAEAGLRKAGDSPLNIGVADWVYTIGEQNGEHNINAETQEIGVSLSLIGETPVMLHNEIGWLPTEAGATYYYSYPRQESVGTLSIYDEEFSVTGTSWFDHQWGDFFRTRQTVGMAVVRNPTRQRSVVNDHRGSWDRR